MRGLKMCIHVQLQTNSASDELVKRKLQMYPLPPLHQNIWTFAVPKNKQSPCEQSSQYKFLVKLESLLFNYLHLHTKLKTGSQILPYDI